MVIAPLLRPHLHYVRDVALFLTKALIAATVLTPLVIAVVVLGRGTRGRAAPRRESESLFVTPWRWTSGVWVF